MLEPFSSLRVLLPASARVTSNLATVLLSLATLAILLAPSAASAQLTCERLPSLLREFLQSHYSFHYLNDDLRSRTIGSYIKRLDPSKTLFLQGEKKVLEKSLRRVFVDFRRGDCSALTEIRKDMIKRYERTEDFVRGFVGSDDYALDATVELIIDPDKRSRPRTPETRDDLHRRLIHFQMSNYITNGEELPEAKRKLIHRYELTTKRAREMEDEDSYAAFLDAFASALDPHSNYFTEDAMEDFQIGMELSLEGIGVALSSRDGYSVVEKVIPGGAADQLGELEPNDKIIAVAQAEGEFVDIIDMNLRDVVRLIRGKRGTTVRLSVLRQSEQTERLMVSIVRDKIKLEESAAALRFETVTDDKGKKLKLAVLELPSFYGGRNPSERQSSRDMRNLLHKVNEAEVDGLLLDLSRNGGGLLDPSVEIAGLFIREGGIVAVKNSFSKVQVLNDPDASLVYDGPLVVLTSRISASASEIVAGAMKDYQRAILVGDDHTFGKGTVQSMVPLKDMGALKVTTALFFRPGGASTQHRGVTADIVFPSIYTANELGEEHQDYSLPPQKIEAFLDPTGIPRQDTTDPNFWKPITPEVVAELARLSAIRIEESEEFAKIQKQIREVKDRNGVLHLSDIYKPPGSEDAEQKEGENESGVDTAENDTASNDTEKSTTQTGTDGDPLSPTGAGAGSKAASGGGGAPGEGQVASTAGSHTSGDGLASIPPNKIENEPSEAEEASPQQREALQILADFVRLQS